jgi:hypothetical protein
MAASEHNEIYDTQTPWRRPMRSQSAWRSYYFPEERTKQHVRRPNAFVAARMGYRAVS